MFSINKVSNSNPLLDYYHLRGENISCNIFPNLGASIQELQFGGFDVIRGIQAQESDLPFFRRYYPSSFLFPFPGRVAGGTYEYQGKHYQLPTNEGGRDNAIHGFLAEAPFELVQKNMNQEMALLDFQYQYDGSEQGFPFPTQINIIYEITNKGFQFTLKIINTGNSSFPFGLGWHPYFASENLAAATLDFQAIEQLVVDENQIPTGAEPNQFISPIGNQQLDTSYLLSNSMIRFSSHYYNMNLRTLFVEKEYLQLYTPPSRNSIAIEPMTCEPNAFNSHKGLQELAPNASYQWSVQVDLQSKL